MRDVKEQSPFYLNIFVATDPYPPTEKEHLELLDSGLFFLMSADNKWSCFKYDGGYEVKESTWRDYVDKGVELKHGYFIPKKEWNEEIKAEWKKRYDNS